MALTRRSLFKFLGAAIIASPFLAVSPALAQAEKISVVPLTSTEPLNHGWVREPHVLKREIEPVYLGTETVVPKIHIEIPSQPTMADPLGQWGFVAWKVKLPNGQQYGNWLKLSTDISKDSDVYEYGVRYLDEEMKSIMKKLAPNLTVKSPAVNLQLKPGYTERVIYLNN